MSLGVLFHSLLPTRGALAGLGSLLLAPTHVLCADYGREGSLGALWRVTGYRGLWVVVR